MSKSKLMILMACISGFFVNCTGNPYAKGEITFKTMCAQCHMEDGSGLGGNIPSLNRKEIYTDIASLTCTISYGKGNGEDKSLLMPAFDQLTDIDLANLINYLNHHFGDDVQYIPADLQKLKDHCVE